jgi:hypothetical protein
MRAGGHSLGPSAEDLKDVIKPGEFQHKPGLIPDASQAEVLPALTAPCRDGAPVGAAPEDFVTSYQSRQPPTVDKGHMLQIDQDTFDALLGQVFKEADDLLCPAAVQWPLQVYQVNACDRFVMQDVHLDPSPKVVCEFFAHFIGLYALEEQKLHRKKVRIGW